MKRSAAKQASLLANSFQLLVAVYFIIIAIVSLVQLRWYHQLTITVKVRHIITSATSYFAFFILIFTALILIGIFVTSSISLSPKSYISPSDEIAHVDGDLQQHHHETLVKRRLDTPLSNKIVLRNSSWPETSNSSVCCSILVHLVAAVSLVIILVIWLLNTGELVRDSISTQLDSAFAKYQFSNRSNYYSVAIDGMQDINNCCGSLDYTDFPHQRSSGLSNGHYPGSCCGKNIFGVNARVICTPEEIWRAKQTVSSI